jgi:hypothetical protein
MKRADREQARWIAAYVDGCVIHRRVANRRYESVGADERELGGLRELADSLNELDIVVPDAFSHDLIQRLRSLESEAAASSQAGDPVSGGVRAWVASLVGGSMWAARAITTVAAVVAGLALASRYVVSEPVVSAKEIVSRSDAAFARLVRPGQVLYRQWRVTITRIAPDGTDLGSGQRTIHEWMDGADFDRVAGRWYSGEDQLFIAYTTKVQPNGEHRAHVYFSPGAFGEARGLLNVEPTPKEFDEAVGAFPPSDGRALRVYLDRQYLYVPITGERRSNRAVLDATVANDSVMPRVVVSLDAATSPSDAAAYQVRVVDPVSVTFNWRAGAPPRVQLMRSETVRSIARDSYLSVATEETDWLESGRRTITSRRLVEMRTIDLHDLAPDPFQLDVPAGTPVQRQSAREMLSAVLDAFGRLPQFTSIFEGGRRPQRTTDALPHSH